MFNEESGEGAGKGAERQVIFGVMRWPNISPGARAPEHANAAAEELGNKETMPALSLYLRRSVRSTAHECVIALRAMELKGFCARADPLLSPGAGLIQLCVFGCSACTGAFSLSSRT